MINGRSFPYTLRESLIEMQKDEKVKLRVLNGHTESMALHIHGHKPTITHYDGVDNGPGSYITRDVHGMVPAQRIDLELSGVDDGLHSYGQGIWMYHDHVEKTFTTNGVGEGGAISLVVYKDFLDEKGIPKLHDTMSLAPYFTKGLWKRNYPIWQDYDAWRSLGLPDMTTEYQPSKVAVQTVQAQWAPPVTPVAEQDGSVFGKLLFGLLLGLLSYVLIINRQTIIDRARKLINKAKK
jgi:FtsP/CotA-like multicopper oxidase with cupredoxin domain